MQTEVLIVGAGPTGLALACQLIRFGIDFVIIDKNASTTEHSKAIGVHARTLEIYEQIGLADQLIAAGAKAEMVRLIEGGKIRGEVYLGKIGEGMSPYPFLLLVEQGKHERIVYDHIVANGGEVKWETELTGFEQSDDSISATIRSSDGALQTIEAKYLVGCDGAGSFVRNSLGLGFGGSTFERHFYVADVEIVSQFSHDSLYICLSEHTITAFFPMRGSDRNFRIVGTFPEGHDKDPAEVLYEEIEKQISADTELELDITKVNWFSVYKVHSRHVERFSSGRCFLAGDSAHIHTPAGAQGMNTGIQDSYNLAWKLAAVLRQNADETLLETYDAERLANAKRLLRTTDRMFNLGASDDILLGFFRTKIFPHVADFLINLDVVQRAIFPLVSQIGINYRESELSRGSRDFEYKPGDRMPYFEVEGESIFDILREPKFHILVFHDGRRMISEFGNEFASIADLHLLHLHLEAAHVFGAAEDFTLVVRPDNYIGMIAPGADMSDVREYFASVFPEYGSAF